MAVSEKNGSLIGVVGLRSEDSNLLRNPTSPN